MVNIWSIYGRYMVDLGSKGDVQGMIWGSSEDHLDFDSSQAGEELERSDTVYSSDYIEADPSPMATQQRKWLESPSTYFMRECALRPNSAHCRID